MSARQNPAGRLSKEQLDEIVRRLAGALSPQRIILFGSQVYGSPTETSGIDLMILLEMDEREELFDCIKRAYASLSDVDLPVELHFRRATTFDRWAEVPASFEREVHERGRIVYAA